jgi:hypothetical protein
MNRALCFVLAMGLLGCGGGGSSGGGGGGGGSDEPSARYHTPDEILAAAAPTWRPTGTPVSIGTASFLAPTGWETTVYTDGVGMRSPADSNGNQCEIFVLAPRPSAGGDARYQQALDAAQSLFPDGTVFDSHYDQPDPLQDKWRGMSGRGFEYVGLMNSIQQSVQVLPILADFSGTAVPLVVIEPDASTWGCIDAAGDFGLEPASVFHSLTLGSSAPDDSLATNVLGEWFSSDGSVGTLFVYGANGHYQDVSVINGQVETSPGDWHDATASWSGDGSYVVRGDVEGLFPTDGTPESRFVREYEWLDSDGAWQRRICWIANYEGPYTHCLADQN